MSSFMAVKKESCSNIFSLDIFFFSTVFKVLGKEEIFLAESITVKKPVIYEKWSSYQPDPLAPDGSSMSPKLSNSLPARIISSANEIPAKFNLQRTLGQSLTFVKQVVISGITC